MKFTDKRIHIVLVSLLLMGGLNLGLVGAVGKISLPVRVLYLAIGLAAVYLASKRDTYLPFLGDAVIPTPQADSAPMGNRSIEVSGLTPGAKVMYWASKNADDGEQLPFGDPWTAYGTYENQGVATVNKEGKVKLTVAEPSEYKVPRKGLLPKHIHYRVWKADGLAGRVETVYL